MLAHEPEMFMRFIFTISPGRNSQKSVAATLCQGGGRPGHRAELTFVCADEYTVARSKTLANGMMLAAPQDVAEQFDRIGISRRTVPNCRASRTPTRRMTP